MPKNKPIEMPIMPEICATCPFRKGREGVDEVRNGVLQCVFTEGSQTCHSTGLVKDERHDSHLCHGARNFQLEVFARFVVIEEPTDESWDERCRDMGLPK